MSSGVSDHDFLLFHRIFHKLECSNRNLKFPLNTGEGKICRSNCRIPGPPNVLLKKLPTRSAVPKSMNEKKSVKGYT